MVRTKVRVYTRNVVWECENCKKDIEWEVCEKCKKYVLIPTNYTGELFCYGGAHYCLMCGEEIFGR